MGWWVDKLMSWCVESTSWWVDGLNRWVELPKKHQNDPRSAQKRPQNDQKSDPERQDEIKNEPRRSWDRLGSPPQARPQARAHPRGSIWEAKTVPKSIPKRSKIEEKNQEVKKPIQDDLGSVLRRSWAVLGAILGPWKRSGTTPADVSWTFTFSMLRRFEDGLGTNFGRPRRQNDRKWPPRRSPNRPQDDQKSMSKST